jgi:hypothetical protein
VLYPFVVFAWLFFLLKGVRWVWLTYLITFRTPYVEVKE